MREIPPGGVRRSRNHHCPHVQGHDSSHDGTEYHQIRTNKDKDKDKDVLNSHLDAQDFASRDEALQKLTLGLGNKTKIGNYQPGKNVFTLPSWPGSSFVDEKTVRPPDNDPLGFREVHCALYLINVK